MNRNQLVEAATKDIVNGDSPRHGSNPQIHYLAAIAKLLAQELARDADASPRITHRTWLPGDPV